MRNFTTLVMALAIVVGSGAADAPAQGGIQWRGGGGWGPGAPYARRYDPKTVETISGEVVSVDSVTPMQGMGHGVHLLVKTEKETVSVHLGPDWFIENQDVKLEAKDRIEVKGSRVTLDGASVLIASELTKGDRVLTLRDSNGIPVWSGWRRRGQ